MINSKILEEINTSAWKNNTNPNLLGLKIELKRNIDSFIFPNKLEKAESAQIGQMITNIILKSQMFLNGKVFKWASLSRNEQKSIKKLFWIEDESFGINKESIIIVDKIASKAAFINCEDHVNIIKICFDDDHSSSLDEVMSINDLLLENVILSFSEQFGFLTKNLNHCGTGVVVSSFLSLPVLKIFDHLNKCTKEISTQKNVAILQNNKNSFGNYCETVIQNESSIRSSESDILKHVADASGFLIAKENQYLKSISQTKNEQLMDMVCRAFGIIQNSIRLKAEEAEDIIHVLKMGLSMGFVSGTSQEILNTCLLKAKILIENGSIESSSIRALISQMALNI